jgi:hypothetical protein
MGASLGKAAELARLSWQCDKKLLPLTILPLGIIYFTSNSTSDSASDPDTATDDPERPHTAFKSRFEYSKNPVAEIIRKKRDSGGYDDILPVIPEGRYI